MINFILTICFIATIYLTSMCFGGLEQSFRIKHIYSTKERIELWVFSLYLLFQMLAIETLLVLINNGWILQLVKAGK